MKQEQHLLEHGSSNWLQRRMQQCQSFQNEAYEDHVNGLEFIKRVDRKLILKDGRTLIDFASCSYLGLDLDTRVIQGALEYIQDCGVTFPIARTRIRHTAFDELELLLQKIFCNGFPIVFNSLHTGHLGVIPLLAAGNLPSFPLSKKGTLFVFDRTVHASIQVCRNIVSQFGEVILVEMSHTTEVEAICASAQARDKNIVLFADGVGSMGGLLPVAEIVHLAQEYGAYLYLDDAHGTSVFGHNGCGYILSELNHIFHPQLILTSSLAKAFGSVAGVVLVPTEADAQVIKRFSSTYIFGGPPFLSAVGAALASARIHLSDEIKSLQQALQDHLVYFDHLLHQHRRLINCGMHSPVRGLRIGDEEQAIACAKTLQEQGYAVVAAMYPTVPMHQAMLRITLSAAHQREEIASLCATIHGSSHFG